MMLAEYLILALGGVVMLLIYYIFSRDSQQSRQIRAIATAVEKLNHQIYLFEQEMKRKIEALEGRDSEHINEADLRYELEVGISEFAQPLQREFQKLQEETQHLKEQLQQRVVHLEESVRNLSLPASVNGMDDARIIALYKQGVDLESISKELRLSKPEVEFVLKINQLK